MSDGINMRIGNEEQDGFKVKLMCGCRVVFGEIPISEFTMLTHGFSKKALMAADIADRIGASLVIGEPGNLEELRKVNLPVSGKRHADHQAATHLGLHKVALWLREGERGSSSNAMCKHIFGVPQDAGDDYPHDPADLRRCLLFLDAAEAHDKVDMMRGVSPEWAALVEHWGELSNLLKTEMAHGNAAPKTYALMKEVLP